MDSKKRSKILYDDPNSMFKANRTVYLHELQGSTLKSKKPLPDDINVGLKTSESMVKLIAKLSQLDVIIESFFSIFNDPAGMQYMAYSPNITNIKEATALITSSSVLIKQMLKSPQSSFSEDNVFSILQLYQSMNEHMQYISNEIMNTPPQFMEQFFLGTPYKSFHKKVQGLFNLLDQLLPYANVSGISLPDITGPQPIDPPDNDDEGVPDYEVAPPLEGAGRRCMYGSARRGATTQGAGRYNVLSTRMSKIQQHPYKRFL
jgi:hypothetical protein